jgi:hypothetical protein
VDVDCRYHRHWRLDSIDFIIDHHMLSQVLKLNATLSQCHDKLSEVQMLSTYKCNLSSCGDSSDILKACKIFKPKLAMG